MLCGFCNLNSGPHTYMTSSLNHWDIFPTLRPFLQILDSSFPRHRCGSQPSWEVESKADDEGDLTSINRTRCTEKLLRRCSLPLWQWEHRPWTVTSDLLCSFTWVLCAPVTLLWVADLPKGLATPKLIFAPGFVTFLRQGVKSFQLRHNI